MDRINKFLEKRPIKGQKIIKYNGNKYKVTKSDLKLVRSYRENKCLDKSFDVSKNYPPTKTISITPIIYKPSKVNKEILFEKTKKRFKNIKVPTAVYIEKNEIIDIWPEEDLSNLEDYKPDFIESVYEAYNKPIEECRYTEKHLNEDSKRIFLKYFRPRIENIKKLQDLLPKMPDLQEMRPFPNNKSKIWIIGGTKFYAQNAIYSICRNVLEIYNIRLNKLVEKIEMENNIEKVRISKDGICLILVGRTIYRIENNKVIKVIDSISKVNDLSIDGNYISILTSNSGDVYNLIDGRLQKRFLMKNVKPLKIKMVNNIVYVATTNGIMIEGIDENQIKSLNYVIDFCIKAGKIYVINNIKRLVEITAKGTIANTMTQENMGIKLACHSNLNLIAIAYTEMIGIYKKLNSDYFLVNSISETCHSLDWHESMPWLYISKKSKVILYS